MHICQFFGITLLLLSFLLLLGCFCPLAPPDMYTPSPPAVQPNRPAVPDPIDLINACEAQCTSRSPNTFGYWSNNTCTCRCQRGFVKIRNACMSVDDYVRDFPAICNATCKDTDPHTEGHMRKGSCACRCEQGYFSFNQTCFNLQEFQTMAPVYCPPEFPVLKYYDWEYDGRNYNFYLCYANSANEDYSVNRSTRSDYWNFVDDPFSAPTVETVARMLDNLSIRENMSDNQRIGLAIAFVQSLPYTYDNASTPYDDYPRYPSETIFADGGDCEDTAILMDAVLKKMGYSVVLFHLPRHVASGVACDPKTFDYNVTSFAYNGRSYCYLETTGEGYLLGEWPGDMKLDPSKEVEIIPLHPIQPDLYIRRNYSYGTDISRTGTTRVFVHQIHVDNYGTAPASGVRLNVGLEAEDGHMWDENTRTIGGMPLNSFFDYNVSGLRVPTGNTFRIVISVSGDNFNAVDSKTGWIRWN